MKPHSTNQKRHGNFGLLLILVGILLLAGNIGILPQSIKGIIFRWPMIPVVIGLVILFNGEIKTGFIIMAIGSFFMIPHLVPGLRMADVWVYWPVLIILAGLLFLSRRNKTFNPADSNNTINNNFIDEVAVFGGNVRHITSQDFQGGKITSIFGGSELHFTNSKLSSQGAIIDIAAIFGGSKIIVPRNWNVKVEVIGIFGGFSDKRLQLSQEPASHPTLIIKGVSIFGGGEISSY